jgi:hypothetical protein
MGAGRVRRRLHGAWGLSLRPGCFFAGGVSPARARGARRGASRWLSHNGLSDHFPPCMTGTSVIGMRSDPQPGTCVTIWQNSEGRTARGGIKEI